MNCIRICSEMERIYFKISPRAARSQQTEQGAGKAASNLSGPTAGLRVGIPASTKPKDREVFVDAEFVTGI